MRVDNLPSDLTQTSPLAQQSEAVAQRDDFLKLLVAQLEHQDPLQPQDGADFVAQLAQFSSLEQATQTNERLAALADSQAANQRAALTDLVGRSVTASADTLQIDPAAGDMPALGVHLDGAASNVDVVIKDDAGHEVRHIHMGAQAAGDAPLAWDGTGDNGEPLPAGTYHVEVVATDAKGGAVTAGAQLTGRVHSVKFDNGATSFAIGSVVIQPGSIVSVEE
jgi:flagellar basal-body rod modification protein FlgD